MRFFASFLSFMLAAVGVWMTSVGLYPHTYLPLGINHAYYLSNSSQNFCTLTDPTFWELATMQGKLHGETCEYLLSDFSLDEYLQKVNGNVCFVEVLFDSVNYYCTADMPYQTQLNGQAINLHICVKQDAVAVGTPVIFGGY